jgi:zinc protease
MQFPRSFILTAATAAIFASPAFAKEPEKVTAVEGITEYRLDNGLRVLLFPDASKPVVTVNCTIFVGSRHEGYGETGMAHLLEHMVFKGTPTFPDVPKALRDHGAEFNGTTWVDRTNYFEKMPGTDENLEFAIQLEADRLVHSYVKREDLLSEMTVVRNEFEMGENSPEQILLQRIMAASYEWHNYGKSTIGNRSDIERVPIENLQRFYKKFYQVDNAMLVIAGKFDEKKALEYVQQYFGALTRPSRRLDQTYTEEPAQDGERLVTLRRVGTVAAVGAAYHIPAAAHPDFPAVEVLEATLSTEPSGRLYKALVATKLASGVFGIAFSWHDPGLLVIGATCEPKNRDAVRDAVIDTAEKIPQTPITAEEVDRAKTQLLKRRENLMADSGRIAITLSEWAACGDWRLFFLHRDRLEKVTVAEVNAAAAKYLLPSNRTLGMFIPTEKPVRTTVAAAPKAETLVKDYQGRAVVKAGEAFDPTPANLDARIQKSTIGAMKVGLLPKKTRGETATVQIALRYGNEESLKKRGAVFTLFPEMLERGTKKHTRQQIQDALEKLGAKVQFQGEAGALLVTLRVKRPDLPAAMDMLTEILREPTFPEKEFELLKVEMRDELDKGRTDPMALAANEARRRMSPYSPDDPRYVPTIPESLERLAAVKLADVKEFYESQMSAQAGEVAVIGDVEPAAMTAKLETLFKDWTSKVPYRRVPRPAHPEVKGGRETIRTPDKANALYVAMSSFEVGDSHPDYAALEIGNFLFGGGPLASRLADRVRKKDGLSYGVMSMLMASPRDPASVFMMYAICNPTNIEKVDTAIAEELNKFLADGPTDSELLDAQKGYLESKKVGRTNDGQLATQLINALSVGRTFAYYSELEAKAAALSPDEVKAAFRKHVDPKKLVIIRAGDIKK